MRRALEGIAASLMLGACGPEPPVRWGEVVPIAGADRTFAGMIALTTEGIRSVPPEAEVSVADGAVCPGTVRLASDGTGGTFAAWWAPRDDGSAELRVARRRPGPDGPWEPPVIADGRDRSRTGCNRPAPAIAADGSRGYVHLAYYLDAPEGAAFYGGHSMERGEYFHGPVVVVYGDRPGRAAIATSGNLVAIAYEDPNSTRGRVNVAISESAGHLFEHRMTASPPSAAGTDPAVAISGRRIAVAWIAESSGAASEGVGRRMARIGELGTRVKTSTPGGAAGEADRSTHDR